MRRINLILAILLVGLMPMFAKPVDDQMAQAVAQKFSKERFALERQGVAQLVQTGLYDSYYVYNIGDKGFVIVAADDAYRPVIGYSDESSFDVNDVPPALQDYLESIALRIHRLRGNGDAVAPPLVAAEWESVLAHGKLLSRNGGRGVDYLCQTKWNQTYPYNYCCPEDPAGSGGHAIVGCLATAMSQLMRFWAMPAQGIGSHCYYHDTYGQICADFGNTTYDWEHMPNVLNNNSSEEEKVATGTLCFHCGVTIDMGYGPDGSGGASGPIPGVMHTYFNYSDANVQLRRDDYETETWKTMVREQFDMGWPMYYGGCQDGGCHAFVCDGYDDFDMFHFNLGWGGGSDGWYLIDEAPYTSPADAMFNFVPAEVYNQTPMAPADLTAEAVSDTELKVRLRWTNPTATLDGTALNSLQEVVVMRDNRVVQTLTDVAPGDAIEVVDEDVPHFDVYHYAVYATSNGRHGKHANVTDVMVGPTCTWKILMTSSDFGGWNGGYVSVYNASGHEIAQATTTSSSAAMAQPELTLGTLSFGWTAPEDPIVSIGIIIKDAENNTVYSFSGPSEDLPSGIFFETNNSCGGDLSCGVPEHLSTISEGDFVRLTWDGVENPGYGYNIYRDGLLFRLVPSATTFLDEECGVGGHCYRVTVLCEGGESGLYSNESCASAGPCYPPRDLDYELLSNYKVKLLWEAPSPNEGLSGYFLYRKRAGEEYKRIKILTPSALSYTDNSLNQEDDYYYRLYAYYQDLDALSAPANRKYQPDVFELHVYYSPTEVSAEAMDVQVLPNPTTGMLTLKGSELAAVEVYNVVGQSVIARQSFVDGMTLDLGALPEGVYFVRLTELDGNSVVRKVVKSLAP